MEVGLVAICRDRHGNIAHAYLKKGRQTRNVPAKAVKRGWLGSVYWIFLRLGRHFRLPFEFSKTPGAFVLEPGGNKRGSTETGF